MNLFVEMKRRGCSKALGLKEAKTHSSLKLEVGGWDIRQSKKMGTVIHGHFYCIVCINESYYCVNVLKY